MSPRPAPERARRGTHRSILVTAILFVIGLGPSAMTASASLPIDGGPSTSRTPAGVATSPPPGYLSLLIGRALYSKATSTCQTPTGMLTLDQVVPALYAGNIPGEPVTRPGITLTANVIPDRTLATTTNCFNRNLYPSWADLSSLSHNDGLTPMSASQSYDNMTTLPTQLQIQQSCGSLSAFISNGFHRAWGLFAYPDNHYNTTVQGTVVDNCFAFGRTYVRPGATAATNQESTMTSPWLQKTVNVSGGRCHISTLACSKYHASTLSRYASPLTLAALTNVAPGNWTALQTYTFVTGVSTSGSILWDCSEPESHWQAHWTSLFEVYCWNDYLYALSKIPSSVVITDPASVAESWGRIPLPYVAVSSTNPLTVSSPGASTTISWSSWENGAYSVDVGGTDCTTGTPVGGGTYTTSPSTATVVVPGSALSPGSNTLRICLTNDAGHTGSATTAVTYTAPPTVTNVSPNAGPLAAGTSITITGTNFTSDATVSVGGAVATGVVWNSYTSISAVVPSAPNGAGPYDVIVTGDYGPSPPGSGDQFTYEAAPTVISLSPTSGTAAGGTTVTISGTNFYADASLAVSFGGVAGTGVTWVSSNTVTVAAPSGTAGAIVDVRVTDAGGTSVVISGDAYTYTT
jgi:hypothetical protein